MAQEYLPVEVKAAADNSRVLKFVGSTAGRDRMGDEIAVEGWDLKNFAKNPVFLWAHRRDMLPIGRAVNVEVAKGKLLFDVEFAPPEINEFADQVYAHYKSGFLRGVSVGFQAQKSERIDETAEDEVKRRKAKPDIYPGRKFLKQELLELSAVSLPANPEALMSKAYEEPSDAQRHAFDEWFTGKAAAVPELVEAQKATEAEAPAPAAEPEDTRYAALEARIAQLEEQIEDLEAVVSQQADEALVDVLSDVVSDGAAVDEGASVDCLGCIDTPEDKGIAHEDLYACIFGAPEESEKDNGIHS